jgi:hypothetical protein
MEPVLHWLTGSVRGTALAAARPGKTQMASKEREENRANIASELWLIVELGLYSTDDCLSV